MCVCVVVQMCNSSVDNNYKVDQDRRGLYVEGRNRDVGGVCIGVTRDCACALQVQCG